MVRAWSAAPLHSVRQRGSALTGERAFTIEAPFSCSQPLEARLCSTTVFHSPSRIACLEVRVTRPLPQSNLRGQSIRGGPLSRSNLRGQSITEPLSWSNLRGQCHRATVTVKPEGTKHQRGATVTVQPEGTEHHRATVMVQPEGTVSQGHCHSQT